MTLALDWPFKATLTTSEFGWRTLQSGARNHHNGLDFWYDGIEGDPIYAVEDGEVVDVFRDGVGDGDDLGNAIRIRHQEHPFRVSTGYAHMQAAPRHKVGDKVKKGDLLGHVGNTGFSFGAHLHFETWVGTGPGSSVRINPREAMRRFGSGHIAGATTGTPASSGAGKKVKTTAAWWTYKTAADARSLRDKVRTIPAGTYEVLKRDGNAVYLSGKGGKGWVHGSVAGGPAPAKSVKSKGSLRFEKSWYYYWTATNAAALKGWSKSRMLAPGTYSIVQIAKNGSIQVKSRFGNVWLHRSAKK